MRYSIMLQLVAGTTLILLSSVALFAWVQNRPQPNGLEDVSYRIHP